MKDPKSNSHHADGGPYCSRNNICKGSQTSGVCWYTDLLPLLHALRLDQKSANLWTLLSYNRWRGV